MYTNLNEIAVVGNIAKQLEKIFPNLAMFNNQSIFNMGDRESIKKIEGILKEYILPLFPEPKEDHYLSNSFCLIPEKGGCDQWHRDRRGRVDMVTVAWPSPTLITDLRSCDEQLDDCSFSDNSYIDNKLSNGEIQLFKHEPGDIIYIPSNIVHKRNPEDDGKKHLLIRQWGILDYNQNGNQDDD